MIIKRHKHRWKWHAYRHINVFSSRADQAANLPSSRRTEFIGVCEGCGDPMTKTISGLWFPADGDPIKKVS